MSSFYGLSSGLLCSYKSTASTTIHASVAGGGDGTSAGSPVTVATAVAAAGCNATILLAAGTYTGTTAVRPGRTMLPETGASVVATGWWLYPAGGGALVRLGGIDMTAGECTISGVDHLALEPTGYARDGSKMGVIYCHSAQANHRQMVDGVSYSGVRAVMTAVAAAGYPVIAVPTGDAWGNDTAMTRITAAKAYLQATLGAKTGAVALIGVSMGAANALNWAKRNLASVACAVGMIPVSDISDIHTNNRGGLTTNINSAYGTWSEATYGAARNPVTFAAADDLAGLDYLAFGATSDAVCLPATVEAVVTSIGGTATYVAVPGGHSNAAIANISSATVISFLDANQT